MVVMDRKGRRILTPVAAPKRWVAIGLVLQLLGVGPPAAYLISKIRHENIGGHITAATVRLTWHGQVHTTTGLLVLIAGAAVFAIGSVVMARPYVNRPATLFIAVPVAAVAGMLILGVVALLIAAAITLAENLDLSDTPDVIDGAHKGARRLRRSAGGPTCTHSFAATASRSLHLALPSLSGQHTPSATESALRVRALSQARPAKGRCSGTDSAIPHPRVSPTDKVPHPHRKPA